jgi:hypothetical protein
MENPPNQAASRVDQRRPAANSAGGTMVRSATTWEEGALKLATMQLGIGRVKFAEREAAAGFVI